MGKILVIEDDEMLNAGLCYNLELDGFQTVPAQSMAAAWEIIQKEAFQLILLDVNLPDGDGFELCRKIKMRGDTPVVFLTARDLECDAIKGFDLGADDYITKPFSVSIFRKKVAAIMKRTEKTTQENITCYGDLMIDFDRLSARINDEPVYLTPAEYKILKIFTDNSGILLTRRVLLEKFYDIDADFVEEHALTVNINRLRSKIETGERKFIKTVYGMGYLWTGEKQ